MSNREPKSTVSVYCSIRPLPEGESEACCYAISKTCVALRPPSTSSVVSSENKNSTKDIVGSFSGVYSDKHSQSDKFKDICIPMIVKFLRGAGSAVLFTYGVTGSGKTYTMSGTDHDPGILPRCLDVIFNSLGDKLNEPYTIIRDKQTGEFVRLTDAERMLERQRRDLLPSFMNSISSRTAAAAPSSNATTNARRHFRDTSSFFCLGGNDKSRFTVLASYIEVYNKQINDLLDDNAWSAQIATPNNFLHSKKQLRTNGQGESFVFDCTEVEVRSADDAFDLFSKGNQRRKNFATKMNTSSSRGHAIFSLHLIRLDNPIIDVTVNTTSAVISRLCLVDLAGSERQIRACTDGQRLKEANNINSSLLVLRQCFEILSIFILFNSLLKLAHCNDIAFIRSLATTSSSYSL